MYRQRDRLVPIAKALLPSSRDVVDMKCERSHRVQAWRHRCRWPRGSVAAAAIALATGVSFAQPAKVGVEFQVNSYTTVSQSYPAVAIDWAGAFVVVWQSSAQDGEYEGIFAQRFDAGGIRLGSELQVNLFTAFDQRRPAVAADVDGDIVVTWQSGNHDGGATGIFARRFDSSGAPQGGEFQVNSYTTGEQRYPAVAMSSAGAFVVTWQSSGQDGFGYGVFARRFDAGGSGQGAELQVNVFTGSDQRAPSVAADSGGGFVVAWQSINQDGENGWGVFARRFDSGGVAQATEFQVHSYTSGGQRKPAVAANADGAFVIAWQSYGQDGQNEGIFARRFAAGGGAEGSEFQVNAFTTSFQQSPAAAMDDAKSFVVTWDSLSHDPGQGIFAQRYDGTGALAGPELQVNTYTANSQSDSAVAMTPGGDFVVVWMSLGQDGEIYGVFGQRFATTLVELDIDDNGAVEPLTDALLFLRYAFGFRGATLVAGSVGDGCMRCDAAAIETYIASILAQVDVDDDASVLPLTDALLVLRYAFGFRGAVLVAGAVGDGCARCDAPAIEAFLAGLFT